MQCAFQSLATDPTNGVLDQFQPVYTEWALKAAKRPLPEEDVKAYLDAAEQLLLVRFEDADRLQAFLDPFAEKFRKRDKWTPADQYRVRAELFEAVISLRSAEECGNFFKDLCTPAELQAPVSWGQNGSSTLRRPTEYGSASP